MFKMPWLQSWRFSFQETTLSAGEVLEPFISPSTIILLLYKSYAQGL